MNENIIVTQILFFFSIEILPPFHIEKDNKSIIRQHVNLRSGLFVTIQLFL